ncbi:hypothetical protein ACJJTC_009492 [Scirpophaga incertulas]
MQMLCFTRAFERSEPMPVRRTARSGEHGAPDVSLMPTGLLAIRESLDVQTLRQYLDRSRNVVKTTQERTKEEFFDRVKKVKRIGKTKEMKLLIQRIIVRCIQ